MTNGCPMSRRNRVFPLKSFLQDDMAMALSDTMMDSIALLPSSTRWRLLAFLHVVGEPKTISAELHFAASGDLTLTLIARRTGDKGHGH